MSKRKADAGTVSVSVLAAELHTLSGKLKRRLREQASAGDLTPSQIAVLMHLDRDGPTTVSVLARAEGVRSQSKRRGWSEGRRIRRMDGKPSCR
jgi:hypothetical protein